MTLLPDLTLLNMAFHEILVSIDHLQRVWHANRGRLLLRTPGPVPLGLAYVLLVETKSFPNLSFILPNYALRISLGTFSILLGTSILLLPIIYKFAQTIPNLSIFHRESIPSWSSIRRANIRIFMFYQIFL